MESLKGRAGGGSEPHASEKAKPKGHVIVDRPERNGIGAKCEERSLREIDLAAKPKHDRQAKNRDRISAACIRMLAT